MLHGENFQGALGDFESHCWVKGWSWASAKLKLLKFGAKKRGRNKERGRTVAQKTKRAGEIRK